MTDPQWPPSPEVMTLMRSVASRLLADPAAMLAESGDAAVGDEPAFANDPLLAAAVRASSDATLLQLVAGTMHHPERQAPVDLPPQAYELAREFVQRDLDPTLILASCQRNQNVAWRHVTRAAIEEIGDPKLLQAALEAAAVSSFHFVESVAETLLAFIDAERASAYAGASAERWTTVKRIVAGDDLDLNAAGARLGYELAGEHTALVLWTAASPGAPEPLEAAGRAVARAAGGQRTLSLSAGRSIAWAWIAGQRPDEALLRRLLGPVDGVQVGIGSTLPGAGGFRRSHQQALAVQRLLSRRTAPDDARLTSYDDVRLAWLATQAEDVASAFVDEALGDFATAPAELRETVRIYLDERGNAPRAAERLYVHRNTVLQRLQTAERLLPRPLASAHLEVAVALETLRWR